MIFDFLANASLYRSLSPSIARGFHWLANFSPEKLDGRYEIAGDDVYALVQSYDTILPIAKKFESHRSYLDIQYVALGNETIYYAPLPSLTAATEYDAKKDMLLYSEPEASVALRFDPGQFAIFFPNDGHKPGCVSGAPSKIKKVVIKARV